jgi:hypothetical protein
LTNKNQVIIDLIETWMAPCMSVICAALFLWWAWPFVSTVIDAEGNVMSHRIGDTHRMSMELAFPDRSHDASSAEAGITPVVAWPGGVTWRGIWRSRE